MSDTGTGARSEHDRGQLTMTQALLFIFVALLSAIAAGVLL